MLTHNDLAELHRATDKLGDELSGSGQALCFSLPGSHDARMSRPGRSHRARCPAGGSVPLAIERRCVGRVPLCCGLCRHCCYARRQRALASRRPRGVRRGALASSRIRQGTDWGSGQFAQCTKTHKIPANPAPPLSSRGLGRRPLTAETRVRIPVAVLTDPLVVSGFCRFRAGRAPVRAPVGSKLVPSARPAGGPKPVPRVCPSSGVRRAPRLWDRAKQ